ncbi:flavin reductase [bacterium]|nr:High molecular weight rubredoxin [bacterium]MBU3954832.1 flavin reductase [bacterium]
MDKKAFFKISYGMYVVSSGGADKYNGQIANTAFQVTAEPPQFAVCINKQNLTHEFIQKSGVFTVSILEQDTPVKFIGHFGFKSGRELDKFADIEYKIGITGAPVVTQNCLAYLECKIKGSADAGTHTVFIGEIVDAQTVKEGEPMTYAYYHQVKNGKSPSTAPTFIKDEKIELKEEKKMPKYKCTVCNYVYDPEKGDSDSGIEPGTSFEDLPDDWVCPVCGVGKDEFEKID